jgi:hypothetical protein
MGKKVIEQVKGGFGGRGGDTLGHQESGIRRHKGYGEALAGSDHNEGSAS